MKSLGGHGNNNRNKWHIFHSDSYPRKAPHHSKVKDVYSREEAVCTVGLTEEEAAVNTDPQRLLT